MGIFNIYFGKVVAINDDQKLNRIKVSIKGKTDELSIDDLSWYYPFLGMDQLPIVNDTIPVIIFNDDFTTGFYLKRLVRADDKQNEFDKDSDDYADYLEIFKRNGIQLTYNKTDGIQFINKNTKIQSLEDEINIFIRDNENSQFEPNKPAKVNHIKATKNRIDLGSNGEATPLGDRTVEALQLQLQLSIKMYNNIIQMLTGIQNGCTNVFTLGIKTALSSQIPVKKVDPQQKIQELQNKHPKIQSKKTFIE